MAVATRIAAKFNTYYAEKPGMPFSSPSRPIRPPVRPLTNVSAFLVLTTMVTNAVSLFRPRQTYPVANGERLLTNR